MAAPAAAARSCSRAVAVPAPVAPPAPPRQLPRLARGSGNACCPRADGANQSEQELAALRQAVATEPAPSAAAPAPAPAPVPTTWPRIVTREGFVHKVLQHPISGGL